MTYDTVVFDNDGVLVRRTSFDVLRTATEETFAQFGVTDPDPDHVEDMAVGATSGHVGTVCQAYGLDAKGFWQTREEMLSQAQAVEAREGRKTPYDDIDELADLDVATGIVSSNQQSIVDFLLEHFDLAELFGTAYGREATIESLDLRKPDSHYLDQALADLGADPSSTLFVGDNESDVRAAENAGVDSAFIRRPHRTDWDLRVWPTWEIDELADLHDICAA